MPALSAEDVLFGQGEWSGRSLGGICGRRRVAKAGKKRGALPVPDFCLSLPPSALVLVWAAQDCCGERERRGGGPRESPEESVH